MKPQLSVLLIEDDPNVRLGCEQAMQLAGIPVDAVATAEEAQHRLTADFPGIVVTDMRLPGMDGMALLRWVNQLDPNLPVIIITTKKGKAGAPKFSFNSSLGFSNVYRLPELLNSSEYLTIRNEAINNAAAINNARAIHLADCS